jgi:hypothetical protein
MAKWRFSDGRPLSKKQVAALKRGQRALRAMQNGAKKTGVRRTNRKRKKPIKRAVSAVRDIVGRWL